MIPDTAFLYPFYVLIPLLAIKTALLFTISFMCYHRMFVTTIDVTLRDYHRFEIPSVPRFFDLRNPRVLKDKEERTRLVSSFYFLRSLGSSPRLSIELLKPSSYPTAALLDRRRDRKKEKETKKERKRRTTGFGVSRGINDLVESIGEFEIDRDDIERASSNLRSTTTLFLAMTPSTPSKSYWCDGTLSSSRGPFDADILPYSTFNGEDSFQEEHEERWPRGEPFHGDVSRIIANVDTTSDVVFPVDKVAFGRRG
ncbi:hypothetical protein V1477_002525 [Vespula maculifrons]|uniref:Uncharacterized protein n=1 Tax=Vespula maculifrons TaxID=7453 RepID=A0ABD2CWV0_VESMC